MTDPFASATPAAPSNGGFDPSQAAGSAEEIDVDFSGTSDDFVPLEDGWYLFNVETATARSDDGGPLLSKAGAPMIKWVARVVDGPRKNSPMFNYTVTSGPGAFSLRRFINHAFGANLGKEPMRLALGPFIGKQFWGQIGQQKGDGDFKEFRSFRPVNDPPPGVVAGTDPAGIASRI